MSAAIDLPHPAIAPTLAAAVEAAIGPRFDALHGFIDRRLAEVSAELHASVELADMTEAKLASQLSSIHERIAQMVAVPAAASRNSGLELEAVVQATEQAADTILEAAEAIQDWISRGREAGAAEEIGARISAIFEACGFQDITGQRIRRAIQHLQQVDDMLQTLMPDGSAAPAAPQRVAVQTAYRTAPAASSDLAQDDIDALLNG
jgi:chemotaxis protein CheZ